MPAPKPEDLGPLAGLVGTSEVPLSALHRGDTFTPDGQVMRCFLVPRGSMVLAGGPAAPDAKTFTMTAECGSETYGILSNAYLAKVARTSRFEVTITVGDDTWSYEETTIVDLTKLGRVFAHTDRDTLRRVAE